MRWVFQTEMEPHKTFQDPPDFRIDFLLILIAHDKYACNSANKLTTDQSYRRNICSYFGHSFKMAELLIFHLLDDWRQSACALIARTMQSNSIFANLASFACWALWDYGKLNGSCWEENRIADKSSPWYIATSGEQQLPQIRNFFFVDKYNFQKLGLSQSVGHYSAFSYLSTR